MNKKTFKVMLYSTFILLSKPIYAQFNIGGGASDKFGQLDDLFLLPLMTFAVLE